MEREKNINIGQDIDVEPAVFHHTLGVFAVVKDENGGRERSGFKRYCWESRERRKGRK